MNAAGGSETAAADAAQAASAEVGGSLTPGAMLRSERERRSMSVQQAAEELHLDPSTVTAIEANRFATLGVPVYARGHLRKYAILLGLSPELIIERYEALSDRLEVPTPVPASTVTSVALGRPSFKGPLWMTIALIAMALGWWIFGWMSKPSSGPLPAPEVTVEPAAVAEPTLVEPAAVATPAVEAPAVASVRAPARAPVVAATNPPLSATPAADDADDVRLRLEYSDASWTEVYDGTGRRLMFGLGDSRRVRTLSGTPPLRVTLGYASAVSVHVNDRAVAVPRQSGRDSARFLVAANGAVQTMSGEVSVE